MKVTVGAIRQIVREETERLHEDDKLPVEAEDAGSMTDSAMVLQLKNNVLELLAPIKDQWNDEIWESLQLLINAWENPQLGKLAMRRLQAVAGTTDEGSAQTSGYADGKASNESINRTVLRNMIMGEAAAIVKD